MRESTIEDPVETDKVSGLSSPATQPRIAQVKLGDRISISSSLLLDVIRLSAALVVLVGHLTVEPFNTGFKNVHFIGEWAVPVFFVLSGFVIRFVTRSRDSTLRHFFIDRAARVYSVAIPAMALTLVVSALVVHFDPAYYNLWFSDYSDHIFSRVALNMLFLSQSWGHTVIPLVDGPFWSLGYECMYYVGYGLIFFMRGWKRAVAVLLWALVAGPQVLMLLPVWYLGCWIYDAYQAIKTRSISNLLRFGSVGYLVLAGLLSAVGHAALLDAPFRFVALCGKVRNPLFYVHMQEHRASTFSMGIGILSAVAILLLLLLSDWLVLEKGNIWVRRFRHLADGTFSIYLLHFPILVVAEEIGALRPHRVALNVTTTVVITALLILAARPMDMLKIVLRDHLRRIFPAAAWKS